jgi:hypothetical protein
MARNDGKIAKYRCSRRPRNLAILAILVALVALFYVLTLVRMGGN